MQSWMPVLSTKSFRLDETTRSDVLHVLQSNTEMLMSDRDLDPDCTMADDV